MLVVIRAFYDLVVEGDGTPPSTSEVSRRCGLNQFTTYNHLRTGVEMGLIDYQMVPGKEYGVRGFRVFHPLPMKKGD